MATPAVTGIDLYWLPLGAGGRSVRLNGQLFEAVAASVGRRDRRDLYHSALQVRLPEGRYVIEQAPAWRDGDERGVVAEGSVGARPAGRLRLLRYEVRRWRDGVIPDLAEAVESPRRLSDDPDCARRLLELVPEAPTPVWGRDELGAGEMWNSNSLISWLIVRSGLAVQSIHPPRADELPAGMQASSSRPASSQSAAADRIAGSERYRADPARGRRHPTMTTKDFLKRSTLTLGALGVAAVLYRRMLRRPS